MHNICKIWLVCSLLLMFSSLILIFINNWQKKYDPENANMGKNYDKMMTLSWLCGLLSFIVSGVLLLPEIL